MHPSLAVILTKALFLMRPHPAPMFPFPRKYSGYDLKFISPPIQPKQTQHTLGEPRQPRAKGVLDDGDQGWQHRQ